MEGDAQAPESASRSRHVRSFVRRIGRITPAQQRAFDAHWTDYGIDYSGEMRDYTEVFGRDAPLIVEIGFGNGEQLLHASSAEPDSNFIGIEVHTPGVGRLMNGLAAEGLRNTRIYADDAVDVLSNEIAPESLAEVRIYFPDPWPKARHNKRRLIQPDLVALIASRLQPGGMLHLATDWEAYAGHMREVLEASTAFKNVEAPGAAIDRPDWRIQTHFERRGRKLGHGVWDFVYRRG
ncbi:MAG: tRNA (guanosine(46)-N7)-methyltransferase TrmB [Dokdonella sp.]